MNDTNNAVRNLDAVSAGANTSVESSRGRTALWIGVALLFALLALAWTAMFFFASKHHPAEVPLETRPAGEVAR